MGWKEDQSQVDIAIDVSQSAFAGYGLEDSFVIQSTFLIKSQSAFAGYGLEEQIQQTTT